MDDFKIRRMTLDDMPLVQVIAEKFSRRADCSVVAARTDILKALTDTGTAAFVGTSNGEVIGLVVCYIMRDSRGRLCATVPVAWASPAASRDVWDKGLAVVVDWATGMGAHTLFMEVSTARNVVAYARSRLYNAGFHPISVLFGKDLGR